MKALRTEYRIENSKPVIYIFGRDEVGHRNIKVARDFEPYVYLPESASVRHDCIVRTETGDFTSVLGEKLKKVIVKLPEDVPMVRSLVKKSYEGDLVFPVRFLIDKVDSLEKTPVCTLFLDIETDNAGRVPNPEIAEFPIVCVGTHNSLIDVYDSFVWRENLSSGDASEMIDDKLHEIHYFRSEKDMLETFVKFFRECEPDVVSGWNLIRFDLKYLVNRMRILNLNINDLSPMGSAYARDKDIVIKGVALVDLYDAYRRFVPNTEESYKLDFISNKVIGKGKTAGDNDVRYMWKFKLEDLIKYNLNDVAITLGIDQKLKLLDFMDELRRLCFCQLEDTLVLSKLIDCYILKYFHGRKIFPTKEHHEKKEFEGGFVGSWAKGIYDNVVSFDLRSLYPNIIMSCSLSSEPLLAYEDWKKSHPEFAMEEYIERYV